VAPPAHVLTSHGAAIELLPLAREICRRYYAEFPDESDRYGPAGVQWCLHDNQYLLAWAVQDARDATVLLSDQALWLAGVLGARDFPISRLIRDLQLASEVSGSCAALGGLAPATADALAAAAGAVAERYPG
jgi:hypothetical protein